MRVAKAVGLPILSGILFFTILLGLLTVAFARTAADREDVRLLLSKPSVYEQISKTLKTGTLQDFTDDQDKSRASKSKTKSADRAAITKVISRYLSVETYNRSVDTVLDGVYKWLDGETKQPQFVIPLADNKADFRDFIVKVFTDRFEDLPACPAGTPVDNNFNPLEASCRPSGYNSSAIKSFISSQTDQPEFEQLYKNASLNSDKLIGPIDGETAANVQNTWGALKSLPWLVLTLIIVTAGLIGLLVFDRSKSWRAVGIAIGVPSLILFSIALTYKLRAEQIMDSIVEQSTADESVNQLIREVGGGLLNLVDNRLLLYSGVLTAIAITMLGTYYVLNRRNI